MNAIWRLDYTVQTFAWIEPLQVGLYDIFFIVIIILIQWRNLKGQTHEKLNTQRWYSLRLLKFEINRINDEISHSKCHFFCILVAAFALQIKHILENQRKLNQRSVNIFWPVRKMCREQDARAIWRMKKKS